jgi:hypothetical protein
VEFLLFSCSHGFRMVDLLYFCCVWIFLCRALFLVGLIPTLVRQLSKNFVLVLLDFFEVSGIKYMNIICNNYATFHDTMHWYETQYVYYN